MLVEIAAVVLFGSSELFALSFQVLPLTCSMLGTFLNISDDLLASWI